MKWLKGKLEALIKKNAEMQEYLLSDTEMIMKEQLPTVSLNWQKYRVKFPYKKFADFMLHMKVLEDAKKKSLSQERKRSKSKSKKSTKTIVVET